MWGTCLVLLTRGHDTIPEERKLSNCVFGFKFNSDFISSVAVAH